MFMGIRKNMRTDEKWVDFKTLQQFCKKANWDGGERTYLCYYTPIPRKLKCCPENCMILIEFHGKRNRRHGPRTTR